MADREFSGDLDLFGQPVLVRDAKRGRPEHVRTPENAAKISLLFALGRSVADAAQALGITQPTLRKHYFSEVEQRDAMLLRLEADQLLKLHDQAREGSVPAMKELLSRVDRAALAQLAASLPADRKREADKVERKGKKQLAAEAAQDVDGIFATRQAPESLQ